VAQTGKKYFTRGLPEKTISLKGLPSRGAKEFVNVREGRHGNVFLMCVCP
jgi:hypothetical protein